MSALGSIPEAPGIGRLANNGMAVRSLQDALGKMETSLDVIPRLFARVVQDDAWRHWLDADHGEFEHNAADFRAFIEGPKPAGCRTPLHILERILRGTDAWEVYLDVIRGQPGADPGNQNAAKPWVETNRDLITDCLGARSDSPPDIIPIQPRDYAREAPTGTSVSYAVRRLKNNRPDLYEQVKAGELTPNRAMVEAGFRAKSITIDDDPQRAARRLLRHFQGERLEALIWALSEGLKGN